MSMYKRADGTTVITRPISDAKLRSKGLIKVVHICPPGFEAAAVRAFVQHLGHETFEKLAHIEKNGVQCFEQETIERPGTIRSTKVLIESNPSTSKKKKPRKSG